tara:strand:+ start:421 stop:918 length:498 start_codon:yes stop_codon:yes gene_type:complete
MENKNLVDILGFEGLYKFDIELNKVYSLYTNKYLKNSLDNKGYYRVWLRKNKIKTTFSIHRLCYMCNYPTEDISLLEIDHIDMDKLNNKIENLRKCCKSDNSSNKIVYKNNKLGIKNISESRNGYIFQLTKNGKHYAKRFKKLQDAIDYRDIKVKEINGEFARLD